VITGSQALVERRDLPRAVSPALRAEHHRVLTIKVGGTSEAMGFGEANLRPLDAAGPNRFTLDRVQARYETTDR
jgi:hypothetical protein